MPPDPWDNPPGTPAGHEGDAWANPPGRRAPPGQAEPTESSSFGSALQYGIANAVPGAHDIGAAIQAGETYLPKRFRPDNTGEPEPGASLSDRFSQQKQRIEAQDEANQRDYPVTSIAAPAAAAALSLPFAGPVDAVSGGLARVASPLPALARSALSNAVVGGGYGAAYGAGSGDSLQEREQNAVSGAGAGALGGAGASVVTHGLGNLFSAASEHFGGAESNAARRIAEAVSADKGAGDSGIAPADVARAQSAGQPIVAADVLGGTAVNRLAREAANSSPEANSVLKGVTDQRYAEQGERTAGFLHNLFGGDLNAADFIEGNKAAARAVNDPNYAQAYRDGANGIPLSPDLQQLLVSPAMKSAVKDATNISADRAAVTGNAVVKNPFVEDAQGNFQLGTDAQGNQATPTLEFWDHVKRALDDQIENAPSKSAQGRLIAIKQKLVSNLTQAVPSYGDALNDASSFFKAGDAFTAGTKALDLGDALKTSQAKAAFAKFSPEQQELFRRGMASQLAQKALNPSSSRNAMGLYNSPEIASRINEYLGPAYAPQVESFVRVENQMNRLRTALGNSLTSMNEADRGQQVRGLMGLVGQAFGSPAAGALTAAGGYYHEYGMNDPVGMAKVAGAGALAGFLSQRAGRVNSETMRLLAQHLASSDPQKFSSAVAAIGKTPRFMQALRELGDNAVPINSIRYLAQPENQPGYAPAYAKGGAVKGRPTHEQLVERLMNLAEKAKRDEKASTKPILDVPDSTVAKALAKAQEAI